ncbi:MAG: AIR synthase related protein, partial [Sphingomicrobium sp.]
VLKPDREAEAEKIFKKWELDFAVIGTVTDTGHMVLEWQGEVVCDIPLGPLADDAPEYDRPHLSLDEYKAWAQVKPLGDVPESTDIAADLLKLMASPNLASRRWIWEQYDQSVGADTIQRPGGDAAVVRVHGSKKALAMTTDCTPRYCYADPYEGGKQAIAEAYRNLSAVGARPLAVTNCLNFGNPQRPEIMAQIVGCLKGMSEACIALDMPIVSGNVSLYNESKATGGGSAILPTPAIGAVGILDDWEKSATIAFKEEGNFLLRVGPANATLGQSLWLREIQGRLEGSPPQIDLANHRRTGEFIRESILSGKVVAAHDISDGGLLVAVAEMALAGTKTAMLVIDEEDDVANWCFAEHQGCFVVEISGSSHDFTQEAWDLGLEAEDIGSVIGDQGYGDE